MGLLVTFSVMLPAQGPGQVVFAKPFFVGIEIKLAGPADYFRCADLAQHFDMLFHRVGQQRRAQARGQELALLVRDHGCEDLAAGPAPEAMAMYCLPLNSKVIIGALKPEPTLNFHNWSRVVSS